MLKIAQVGRYFCRRQVDDNALLYIQLDQEYCSSSYQKVGPSKKPYVVAYPFPIERSIRQCSPFNGWIILKCSEWNVLFAHTEQSFRCCEREQTCASTHRAKGLM